MFVCVKWVKPRVGCGGVAFLSCVCVSLMYVYMGTFSVYVWGGCCVFLF